MRNTVTLDFGQRPSALTYMVRAVLPVRRRADLAPRIEARWHGHRPDPRELRDFRRIAALGPDEGRLPLLYPHVFGFRLAMAILTHPVFPVPIWGVLQVRNRLERLRPIATDAVLDFATCVRRGRAVPKGAEFDLTTTVHVAGSLAWQSDLTFFTRGRFGEPTRVDAPIAGSGPATSDGEDEGTALPAASSTDFGVPVAEWSMSDGDHFRFGHFTGDYNGLHFWDAYARRMGFRRALYHPPRVLGQILAHLPRATGDDEADDDDSHGVRLDAWLKGPVSHGARVRLHANSTQQAPTSTASTWSSSLPATTFALFAGEERPCIVGRLQSLAARPALPSARTVAPSPAGQSWNDEPGCRRNSSSAAVEGLPRTAFRCG